MPKDWPLAALSQHLRGRVPDDIADNYDGNLGAGESQFALEELFDSMVLHEVRIPRSIANEIITLATWFKIPRFTPEKVSALVQD
jgi:hypothetical protein